MEVSFADTVSFVYEFGCFETVLSDGRSFWQ